MSFPSVCVLMSTYNGEKYIREQIDSVLSQKKVELELLIRDDGSKDKTVEILNEYAYKYNNVSLIIGENVGVGNSFFELLKKAPNADYYSFCDQDDVWLEDKLCAAIDTIKKVEDIDLKDIKGLGFSVFADDDFSQCSKSESEYKIPVLYGSNQTIVDSELNFLRMKFDLPPHINLYSSISRNTLYGCTMVFNKSLLKLCNPITEINNRIIARKNHDALVLYVAFITGIVIYDHRSNMFYREHSQQVVGARNYTFREVLIDKAKRLVNAKNKGIRSCLAGELLRTYSDLMRPEVKAHIEVLANVYQKKGLNKLLNDSVIVQSFNEKKFKIYIRGLLRWI